MYCLHADRMTGQTYWRT